MRPFASRQFFLLLALILLVPGCSDRRAEPPKKEPPPVRDVSGFLPGHGPGSPAWSPGESAPPGEGLSRPMPKGPADILASRGEIAGTVTLASGAAAPAGATLYVFVTRPGQPRPPVAAVRIPNPKFPQPFRIAASDVIAGPLSGDLSVSAHLDVDGNASTQDPENLIGEYARNPIRVGQSGVLIEIARAGAPTASSAPPAALAGTPERGVSISGTIRLAPGAEAPVGGVLYISARQGSQITGAPFAVKRMDASRFPIPYVLSVGDSMAPDVPFSGPVSLTARLDADGNASTKAPNDLVGEFGRNPANVGDTGVDITLGPVPPGSQPSLSQSRPSLSQSRPSLRSGPPGSGPPGSGFPGAALPAGNP